MYRIIVAAAVLLIGLAMGQSADAAQKKNRAFQDWAIECQAPSGNSTSETCVASQTLNIKENRLLEFSVGYVGAKFQPMVVALVPLGISLEAGVAFVVDQQPQISLVMKSCSNKGCLGAIELTDAQIIAMRDAKALVVGVVRIDEGQRQVVKIPLSVKGLKPALDSLLK